MFEEVYRNIYRIGVPLPGNPLKMTNAYLLKGSGSGRERHLLVDNGFNRPECHTALTGALAELEVRLEQLDFFITHLHADHNGLTPRLRTNPASTVWCSALDGQMANATVTSPEYWAATFKRMRDNGYPPELLAPMGDGHPAKAYAMPETVDFTPAAEGDLLEYGGYRLRVIEVPGHTPAHLALYAEQEKLFFSGDHILGKITPNITPWAELPFPLGRYLDSLDKTAALDIRLTLPGHRQPIEETGRRIRELKEHHASRLDELRAVLKGEALTAYQAAARMRWSLSYKNWDDFPPPQKWFATGEALAHLRHLEELGELRTDQDQDGMIRFVLKEGR